jgi:hypothetical protein
MEENPTAKMAQRLRVLFSPEALARAMPAWTKGKDRYLLFARSLHNAGFTLKD